MARHRQPLEIAELKGATKKDPQRYRKETAKTDLPLGEAPENFSDEEVACWNEISGGTLPGVMTGADRQILEIAAALLAEYRQDRRAFPIGKYTHLIGCFARLGMSPADRQKVGAEKPKDEKPKFQSVR